MGDLQRPANSASKSDWIAYAKAVGVDTAGTRDEIIARVDTAAEQAADLGEHVAPDLPEQPTVEPSAEADDTELPPADPDRRDPVEPIHTIRVVRDEVEPLRCGGHILVEGHGWVIDEDAPAEGAE